MECNRDEAIRARDLAVTKFAMQDFLGAKKFILKAQQLYPPLEGAAQMLAVLDVHIAAQVKVGVNETDWYGILQAEPGGDDSAIKKHYRKLALLLHPDKNQCVGAEAAFKLIGEAFGVLSDKNKRYLHDSKRGVEPRVAQMASHAPASNPNVAYQAQYQAAAQATTAAAAAATHVPPASLTFWTACPLCRMQYQYMRTYLNQTLLCQKCDKPFVASNINAPASNGTAPFHGAASASASAAAANGATFTWNNGPFPTGPVPPVPRRAGVFNFQAWTPNGGVAAGNMHANGHGRAHGGPHTSGNYPSGGTGGTGVSAAASLVQETYQRVQRARVAAEKAELKRRAKEQEKLVRQQEREAIKKARETAKAQEDLQRLRKKRDEAIEKEARKKAAMKACTKKRLKKRKRDDDDDEDDEDEDEEDLERSNSGYGSQADLTRKSSRHRRSVAYEVDGGRSDDDDTEAFAGAKKFRSTANGGDVGHDIKMEKGKSVIYDDDLKMWGDSGPIGSKAGLVRDNRGGDPSPEFNSLAEVMRLHLRKNVIPPSRQHTQMSGANASNASGDANSVHHVGISSVSNGRGDQKKAEVNGSGEGESGEEQIVVPDPDFHDFDADRTEVHVKKNQVWAVYDETDGMPRFYCQINKVTRSPFSVDGVWLEPIHPQKDTFHWLNDRELSIGTGEFRLGEECDFDSINLFSHLMLIRKNKNGYKVYPRKPEVWAVYRDYERETSKDEEGKPKLRYDFVLVVNDFLTFTGQGRVVGLQKLNGYKTLWVPHGEAYSLTVTYDLHKFSHRVPALSVSETDLKGVPAGCLELDPASTPVDFIDPGST